MEQNENELFEFEEETIELQAFGSSGGKSRVAKKLVSLIPEHKIYIEGFAGGSAVYWKKEPAELSILNDKNSEIAFAYEFIRDCTDEQVNKLRQMNWTPNKNTFFKLRDSEHPKDPAQRFHRFYYVHAYSYGFNSKNYGYSNRKVSIFNRIPKLRDFMKNVKVYNTDCIEVLEKYNNENSFAYLDPPYPDEWAGPEGTKLFTKEDTKKLHDYLKKFKGKFLLNINNLDWIREMFSDFKLNKLKVPRSFKKGDAPKFELIISNYDIKTLSEGSTSSDISSGDPIVSHGLLPRKIYKPKKNKDEDEIGLSEEIFNLIKDPLTYDASKQTEEQLADDWRLICAWYSTYLDTDGKGIKYSIETIINLAKLIYEEIVRRVDGGKMKHDFDTDNMEDSSLELYNIVIEKNLSQITEDIKNLEPLIKKFEPIILENDFISLVGSRIKREEGHKPNDIDVHIRMGENIKDYLERAITVRLDKLVGEKISEKLHIFSGDAEGSHDTFIPIYHLALIPASRKVNEMSGKGIKLFNPEFPEKPYGSAYYDIDKFIEAI